MAIRIFYKTILLCVVTIYILLLMRLLFFNVGATDRQTYFTEREIHFIPFKSTLHSIQMAQDFYYGPKKTSYYWYLAVRNILGNVLLFAPLGLIAPLLNRRFRNLKFITFATFSLSFTAEVTQYFLVIGVADIDDIFYNVAGAIVGYLVFVLLEKLIGENLQQNSTLPIKNARSAGKKNINLYTNSNKK